MKCRRIKEINNKRHIVWFGSYGLDENGKALFYNESNKNDNYSNEIQATNDSLIQRLSILQGELWYNISAGLPLLDKTQTKGMLDTYVASIVLKHPDVKDIIEFNSIHDKNIYKCYFKCITKYGNLTINI